MSIGKVLPRRSTVAKLPSFSPSKIGRYIENRCQMGSRVRPRLFDQVGHETMYASSGNKHFFTKSFHRQTYQNYEQNRQKLGTTLENEL